MAHSDNSDQRDSVDALVLRARDDRDSFGQLYDLYYERIYRYCVRRLYRRAWAEDACSEVFLYVAAHFGQFRGTTEVEFRRWLYRIATSTTNAYVRRTRRRSELMQQAVERDAISGSQSECDQSELDTLDWPRLYSSIAQLQLRDQTIVSLRFFEELSHDEIARILHLKPGTVRVVLSRAIDKLRKHLLPEAKASDSRHK